MPSTSASAGRGENVVARQAISGIRIMGGVRLVRRSKLAVKGELRVPRSAQWEARPKSCTEPGPNRRHIQWSMAWSERWRLRGWRRPDEGRRRLGGSVLALEAPNPVLRGRERTDGPTSALAGRLPVPRKRLGERQIRSVAEPPGWGATPSGSASPRPGSLNYWAGHGVSAGLAWGLARGRAGREGDLIGGRFPDRACIRHGPSGHSFPWSSSWQEGVLAP